MFGYVRPPLGILPQEEADRFRRAYCGLCHILGERYGPAARMILNYDFTYLAILLSDPEEAAPCRRRCVSSPVRLRAYQPATAALELAADESVILAYWQLRDGVDIKYESPSIDSLPSRNSFRRKVKGNVTVTGSPVHDLFLSYQEKLKPYRTRNSEAWDKYLQVYHIPASEGVFNTREGIALTREMNDAQKEITRIQWDFIKANPKSPVSVDVAQNMVYTAKFSKADMDNLLQAIDPSLRETPGYKQLKESLESMAPIALGEKYRDLELVDENGKTVQLSDYVKPGQYNMVEFWASWCGPCRGEIPHLRHVYDAYGKGKDAFNMISVSIDDKEKDWKQALKEENMKWTQLCDLKGWKGEVINKYKIQGVPFCLILDKEGRIIDHGVRGSELDVVLIKYLGDRYEE